jgi:hypothetical protein
VYAQVEADVPWLRVTTPAVSGPQQAQIAFEVDSTLMDAGRPHQGLVQVIANAGQKLAVRVQVECRQPHEPFTRRLLRPFFVGAILALLLRLALAGPADLYARGWGQGPDPSAWPQVPWEHAAGSENLLLRPFVLATWWVGVLLGVVLAWRRGGRLTDVFCGAVAGAGGGLIGSATLGCLLLVLDALPRLLLTRLIAPAALASQRPFWMLLWVVLATTSWTFLGGGMGFLLSGLGRRGLRLLSAAASPLAWLFRQCGFERAAAFFLLQG